MNNQFTLPIVLAVAVHTAVFLGFPHGPGVATGKPVKGKLPIDTIFIVPEIPEERPVAETFAKGSPEPDRPTLADEPRPLKPLDIAIATSPDLPQPTRAIYKFDGRPPGLEDGIEGGIDRGGVPVISSNLLDSAPHTRVQPSPDYPFTARKEGRSGEVFVEFIVDETGRVINPVVVRSTDSIFDEASLRAVQKWRFEPGKRDNKVVRFRMAVPVIFNLGDN